MVFMEIMKCNIEEVKRERVVVKQEVERERGKLQFVEEQLFLMQVWSYYVDQIIECK